MASSSSSKDKYFKNVINPYLREVVQHPQVIQMHEGVLHLRDVPCPKGTGTVEARLEAMSGGLSVHGDGGAWTLPVISRWMASP